MSTLEDKNISNIIDIDLSEIRKKRIRVDGDNNRIVEINISDMGVMDRLQNAYNQLLSLANEYHLAEEEETSEDEDTEIAKIIETLKDLDVKMRELVDYVFNANVSEMCVQDGTMADPVNGQFKFEYIIEKFLALYDKNFDMEFKKMSKSVSKHTNKYTRKK